MLFSCSGHLTLFCRIIDNSHPIGKCGVKNLAGLADKLFQISRGGGRGDLKDACAALCAQSLWAVFVPNKAARP